MSNIAKLTVVSEPAQTRKPSMAQRVFDTLRNAIIQLRLRPGHLLSEAEIAEQLGVSRQPVRESFIKLAEAGLVEIRPQRGTYVVMISRREVENARFLRQAIEVAIVRKAALEATPDSLRPIEISLRSQRQASDDGDIDQFLKLDETFHKSIAASADCEHAWRVIERLKAQMDRVRYLSMPLATPIDTLIHQHEAIFNALKSRSPDPAEAAMREHLSEILKSLPKIAAAHSDMFVE